MKKRKLKIIIGSPAQGAMSYMGYTESVFRLGKAFQRRMWESSMVSLWNEYYVPRARNYMADVCLKDKDATHLLFIDVDETFNADEIVEMVKRSEGNSEYDVMCGTGPMKMINWERVHKMALEGQPWPMLRHASGEACTFRTLPEVTATMEKPFEVRGAGTGIMLIRKEVLEKVAPDMDKIRIPYPGTLKGTEVAEFFTNSKEDQYQANLEKPEKNMITEDLVFCDRVREGGMKIWVDPSVTFGHIGMHIFEGCMGCSNGFYVHEMVKT